MISINDANEPDKVQQMMQEIAEQEAREAEQAPHRVLVQLTISEIGQLHACAMEGLYRRRVAGDKAALLEESMKALLDALVADQAPLTGEEMGALIGVAKTHQNMMKMSNPVAETTPEYTLLDGAVRKLEASQ